MPKIAEVFGHGVENRTARARADRKRRWCPFRDTKCTKSSKADPIGVCSLEDNSKVAATCPVRFVQDGRILDDAARIAFGARSSYKAVPEIKILRVGKKKIGKVDYLLVKIDESGEACDFAALEVQSVYFSGKTIRPALRFFLKNERLDPQDSERRADYRSSAQKRLMPQLRLKVPVFNLWAKKFFVVVDDNFFATLPKFKKRVVGKSNMTWLVYSFDKQRDGDYSLSSRPPKIVHSLYRDVMDALREGDPPLEGEMLAELNKRSMRLPMRTA